MGLRSCVGQDGLTNILDGLGKQIEGKYTELIGKIRDGANDDECYKSTVSDLNDIERALENPMAQAKGLAVSTGKKRKACVSCISVHNRHHAT